MKIDWIVYCLIALTMAGNAIDFDALSKKKAVKKTISMGFSDAVKVNEKRVKAIQKEQARVVSKFLSAAGSDSGSGITTSGNNAYRCSYRCKISGMFGYPTNTFNKTINADTQYEAEQKLHDFSKKHCGSMYKSTTFGKSWMWPFDEKCERK